MTTFYKVTGPIKFDETLQTKAWFSLGPWMSKIIVTYHERQNESLPGKLFRIIWKPINAPKDITRLRIPEDWVTEIPGFKFIDKDTGDKWEIVVDAIGGVRVVRK